MNSPPPFDLAALGLQSTPLADLKPFWPSSRGRPLDDLTADLAGQGLRRPLLVLNDGRELKILAGGRRREALLRLGRQTAPARILPLDTPLDLALAWGLADNRERGWNAAETALMWRFLTDLAPEAATGLAPELGLEAPALRARHLEAAALPEEGLTALADGRLDVENGARLTRWEPASCQAALALFAAVWPSKQTKRQWLDWLEDLARTEKVTPAAILAAPEIKAALTRAGQPGGRPAAEEMARRFLWTRRHPRLAELTGERLARLKSLRLPPAARLELDSSLEDVSFSLRLTFATFEEFQKLAGLAGGLAGNREFHALLNDCPAEEQDPT